METNKEAQRRVFAHDHESGQWSMTEFCQRYGISRPTGYLWLDRYEEKGEEDVLDRPRAPATWPDRTPPKVEQQILALRER